MAYSRWRNENMNTLQRQQMLEAISAFKSFALKNDINNKVTPTIAKKCLQAMNKIKNKKQSVTISEILCLKDEISEIIVSDLIDDSSPRSNKINSEIEDVRNVSGNEFNSSDGYDSSDDYDSSMNDVLKGFLQKDQNTGENPLEMLGKVTGDLMGSLMNPMINAMTKKAKLQIKDVLSALALRKDDKGVTKDQRKFYNKAYEYYSELDQVYNKDISAMEQAMMSEKIKKKYDAEEIVRLLTHDPHMSSVISVINNTDTIGSPDTLQEGLAQIEKMGESCTIS